MFFSVTLPQELILNTY